MKQLFSKYPDKGVWDYTGWLQYKVVVVSEDYTGSI